MGDKNHTRTMRYVTVIRDVNQQSGYRSGLDPAMKDGNKVQKRQIATSFTEKLDPDSPDLVQRTVHALYINRPNCGRACLHNACATHVRGFDEQLGFLNQVMSSLF